jgi:hypothetical protein
MGVFDDDERDDEEGGGSSRKKGRSRRSSSPKRSRGSMSPNSPFKKSKQSLQFGNGSGMN